MSKVKNAAAGPSLDLSLCILRRNRDRPHEGVGGLVPIASASRSAMRRRTAIGSVTRRVRPGHGPGNYNGTGSAIFMVFEVAAGKEHSHDSNDDERYEPFHFSTPFCIPSIVLNAFLLM